MVKEWEVTGQAEEPLEDLELTPEMKQSAVD